MPNCNCTELELHPARLGRGVPAKSCSGFEHRGAQMVVFSLKQEGASAEGRLATAIMGEFGRQIKMKPEKS
jgi:hypothetical protein